MSLIILSWSTGRVVREKSGNFIFLQGQGKVREFCKLIREILNTQKVRQKSGNFIILAQNIWVTAGILSTLNVWKCWFLSRSLITMKIYVNIRILCPKLFKNFICLNCIIGGGGRERGLHFNEPEKRICHLSAARRGKGHKTSVFWSDKNRIWSEKSQGISLPNEGGHPD